MDSHSTMSTHISEQLEGILHSFGQVTHSIRLELGQCFFDQLQDGKHHRTLMVE